MNLVNGAHDAVNGILDHPDIKGVSFVGATGTARYVYARAAANGKRVQASGRRKEPHRRHARREPGRIPADHHELGVRGGRPALPCQLAGVADWRRACGSAGPNCRGGPAAATGRRAGARRRYGTGGLGRARDRLVGAITRAVDEGAEPVLDGRNVQVKDRPQGSSSARRCSITSRPRPARTKRNCSGRSSGSPRSGVSTKRLHRSTPPSTATPPRSSQRAGRLHGSSATRWKRATSASTSAWRRPFRCSRSVERRDHSWVSCILRGATPSASSPRAKWSFPRWSAGDRGPVTGAVGR